MVWLVLPSPRPQPPDIDYGGPFPHGGHVWPPVGCTAASWARKGHLHQGPGLGKAWDCRVGDIKLWKEIYLKFMKRGRIFYVPTICQAALYHA